MSSIQTLTLAQRVFEQPASPFHEKYVLQEIEEILKENRIPYFYDSGKNLIAGVSSKNKIPKNGFAFAAHTDHPGFHFTQHREGLTTSALWMGGGPLDNMVGSRVVAYNVTDPNKKYLGVITQFSWSKNPKKNQSHREGIPCKIKFAKKVPAGDYFGCFHFKRFQLKKGLISTPAADDLAGCVMALGALIDLRKKKNSQAVAIFTRAEEVGFVGCWHLLKQNIFPPSIKMVSLEASRTLPGALLGEGPVVRLGDASTLFDSEFVLYATRTALDLKKKNKNFKFQKKLMDGGSCEATAFSLFGFTTIGMAVPLKNYHNMGPSGAAPEIIHSSDLDNGRQLLVQWVLESKKYPQAKKDLKKRLFENYRTLQPYLFTKGF